MRYFRHGDPLDDFDRLDAEQARYYARLPKCERCNTTIEDDDYYDVDGEILCEDCLKEKFGRKCCDYAEGWE
jgi:hypothetical protein